MDGDRVNWFQTLRSRLGVKILMAMASAMTLTSVIFLAVIVPRYHDSLLNERRAGSAKLGSMLQIALENAMLKRDIPGLRTILNRIGQEANIERAMIVNPAGMVRFSSDPAMLEQNFAHIRDLCPDCALSETGSSFATAFLTDARGVKILRAVNAVANQEPCTKCHGPLATHPVNGYLVIDHSAGLLESQAMWSAVFLAAAGFVCLAGALLSTWLAIRRFVLRPVRALSEASIALADGNLATRVAVNETASHPGDEIAALARSFNRMVAELDRTIVRQREHESFQQALIDGIADGIRVIRADYSVIAANKEFCRSVGMTLEDVLSRPCYASSHARSEPCIPTLVVCPLAALATETSSGLVKCTHSHSHHSDASPSPVEVIASRLEVGAGDARAFYVVESIRDLSRQARVSQEQRLAEIGQLAVGVAHEIRNPLASIDLGLKAISRSLGQGNTAPTASRERALEMMDYMAAVNASIATCIAVTDRLLHLSRLPTERGQLLTLCVLATDIVSLLRYEAECRKVEVTIDIPERLRMVASDGEMRMVVLNLVQNAFHAMPDGGRLTITAREKDDGSITISFTDTGSGISAEHLTKIFYPFWSWRADGSSGSGLGLPISKTTVERWFGRISVTSKLGEGTTFILDFPPTEDVIERM
ncbi:MAG: ATP-binding protein [Alphaproteobacteria bacterium]|nr:ATP-binding protein [Alphaproteobacteria bacterium]